VSARLLSAFGVRRVPLAAQYENFHIAYINETGEPSIETASACGGVEIGGISILPVPCSSEGWLGLERNGQGAAIPNMRFGAISTSRHNGWGPDSCLKRPRGIYRTIPTSQGVRPPDFSVLSSVIRGPATGLEKYL
jgi:hypothetical protein